ncbi:MAG TPA: hypothetical protein PKY81_16915 [bacterium]|nr:hypothetical protein [bacterium]
MSLYSDSYVKLKNLLLNNNYEFIGIIAYACFIKEAHRAAGFIKKYSTAQIIIGGPHASVLPTETLNEFSDFDFAIYGEGEIPFYELLSGKDLSQINNLAWKNNGQIIKMSVFKV